MTGAGIGAGADKGMVDKGMASVSLGDFPSRNSSQCLHFFAVAKIVSPQNGQGFVLVCDGGGDAGGEDFAGDGTARLDVTETGTSVTPLQPGHFIFRPAR